MKRTPLKRKTPIRRISPKLYQRLVAYYRVRDEFIQELKEKDPHLRCQVYPGCKGREVHHMKGRHGALLTDKTFFLWVCRRAHNRIHGDPKWARENGYLL
jgi:hypothetical protein